MDRWPGIAIVIMCVCAAAAMLLVYARQGDIQIRLVTISSQTGRDERVGIQPSAYEQPQPHWKRCPQLCASQPISYACSPSGHTWWHPEVPFIDSSQACSLLRSCNYSTIAFLGDSYLRHVMVGFTLLLTGDFNYGAMLENGRTQLCRGDGQFEEKVCRSSVKQQTVACDGHVKLVMDGDAWPRLGPHHAKYDVVFWGAGRHPIDGNYNTRHGVHHAAAVVQEILQPLCQNPSAIDWISGADVGRHRVYWLLDHYRLGAHNSDELPDVIDRYNAEMSKALSDLCHIPSIDLHTPSKELAQQLTSDAKNMTHDGVHWSRAMNLVFTQILLQRLMKDCDFHDAAAFRNCL